MKMLKKWGFTTLFGLLSFTAFANTATPETAVPQATQSTVPTQTATTNLVNINTASVAELQDKLVGIGEKKAQAIVDYRTKHGNFVSLEQLTEVSGIGKATLDKNRDRIVLQ